MVVCTCQYYSFNSSHPLLLPVCPKNLGIKLSYDPEIPLLGIDLEKNIIKKKNLPQILHRI